MEIKKYSTERWEFHTHKGRYWEISHTSNKKDALNEQLTLRLNYMGYATCDYTGRSEDILVQKSRHYKVFKNGEDIEFSDECLQGETVKDFGKLETDVKNTIIESISPNARVLLEKAISHCDSSD